MNVPAKFSIVVALTLSALAARPVSALESRVENVDHASFHIVQIDLARETLELHWRDQDDRAFGSIDRLREWGAAHGRSLLFAANAGIYDRQFRPLGLYIEDSHTLRPLNIVQANGRAGNFAMQPNGVFSVDEHGLADVTTTERWHEHHGDARIATQSGPMLVVDGAINPNFDAESESLKWRSGVCAKTPQQVVFAVSDAPVSFHAFARLFRDTLGCRNALYLDGTLSRIYMQDEGYFGAPAMMVKPYAGIFAVYRGAQAAD